MARFWTCGLRVFATFVLVLSCSCARHAGHGAQPPQSSPGKPLGHSGCGPPITYQVFQKDAFGVDWSKANDLIAFNAKESDGLFHIYTVKPDGTDRRQLGLARGLQAHPVGQFLGGGVADIDLFDCQNRPAPQDATPHAAQAVQQDHSSDRG